MQQLIKKATSKLENMKHQVGTAFHRNISSLLTSDCVPIPFEEKFHIDVKRDDDVIDWKVFAKFDFIKFD
jgi:hypothetical protein